MRNTLKIQKAINRYKALQRYKKMLKDANTDYIEHYNFYEMDMLREIAALKAESPTSFRFACALDKIILN